MSENIITSLPVTKLINSEKTPARNPRFEHYLIPYYQRGYRWDVENVTALLDDVNNFRNSGEKKYCLQPIVVVPRTDEEGNNIWEVVDGQQRLITMYIIFKFLNKRRYRIIFEKRDKSTTFLENLSEETYSEENPDFHFMSQAYRIIKDWFDEKMISEGNLDDVFSVALTGSVEIIWYQIEELKKLENNTDEKELESKKIDIFNRLNIGKIPLTDAELIRALLLSKIKFGLSERESIMRQAEISNEWHHMEMKLRKKEFWSFLRNNTLSEISSAIELIFALIAGDSSKKYSTFLWFEKYIKADNPLQEKLNAENLWDKTKEYFHKFSYWFEDNTLFHHLGFLLSFEDANLSVLKNIIKNSEVSKSEFVKWAVNKVKEEMEDISLDELEYKQNSKKLLKAFLLYNIITTLKSNRNQNNKFPFHLYKEVNMMSQWSLEHIHAQQSEDLTDHRAMYTWLDETYKAIVNITHIEKTVQEIDEEGNQSFTERQFQVSDVLKNEINALLKSPKIDSVSFHTLKAEVISLFDSESVHFLDNLALLSSKDNSSLNNAIFPVKRRRIIELQKSGSYIPITTMNVFLKFYSTSDLQPYYWSKTDKNNYYLDIKNTLAPYLS